MKVNLCLLVSMILVISCVFIGSSYSIGKDSIVGMWLFDEGQGDVAEDSSGNGHDGELLGDLEWVEGNLMVLSSFPEQIKTSSVYLMKIPWS